MDLASFGLPTVVAIVVICYLIGLLVKAAGIDNKWIPIICGFSGLLLGVVRMLVMPDYPANDYMTASAIGAFSGLAATGVNQIVKQFSNNK